TMTVGTLVKWLKKEGDKVASGDMLSEVETDKATMELESFFDGTLLKIFAPDGSQVELGAPLCAIGKPGEKVDVPEGKSPAAAAGDRGEKTDGGEQKKTEPENKDRTGASTAAKNETQAQPAAETKPAGQAPAPRSARDESGPAPAADGERIKISPLARKLAAEKGIDPSL